MKKNKIEGEEAEEEMDECKLLYRWSSWQCAQSLIESYLAQVHHENEELHLQVEKLHKENSQMKAKLAILSDESEKLGGLKVMNKAHNFNFCHHQ
jgi:hypothetical protein